MRHRLGMVLASLLSVSLMVPAMAAPASAASSKVTWTKAKVVRWVDGDTVVTSKGRIRVIGVDTPEVGRCGATKATRIARRTAPAGSVVRLGNPRSVDNRDRYQRNLRYVVAKSTKVDISAKQIRKGSKARYDGRDGYDWHPRQAKYRKIDRKNADYKCTRSATPTSPTDTYTGCRAYGPNGTSVDDQGRRYTKINCTTKQPL